jgi:peptidoglycan biosynthesis protein MviN/MurJ (putative lipid II flippase)
MAYFQHHISHQAVRNGLTINAKLASSCDISALLIKHAACAIQAMQVQNMVWAPAVITVLTALANVPINMVLIAWYDFWGAALATSVARILQLALLCGELST